MMGEENEKQVRPSEWSYNEIVAEFLREGKVSRVATSNVSAHLE